MKQVSQCRSLCNLRRECIESALDQTDQEGVPRSRESTKYCLANRGWHYPPKLILGRAIGEERPLEGIHGGEQTTQTLRPSDHSVGHQALGGRLHEQASDQKAQASWNQNRASVLPTNASGTSRGGEN